MITDSISDLIIRLKNGSRAGKSSVLVPYSALTHSILEVLQKEGFLKSFSKRGKKFVRNIEVELLYEEGRGKVTGVRRISKPSKRIYRKARVIYPVRGGFGKMIISTPKGIVTDSSARKERIGGEVLFEIW